MQDAVYRAHRNVGHLCYVFDSDSAHLFSYLYRDIPVGRTLFVVFVYVHNNNLNIFDTNI